MSSPVCTESGFIGQSQRCCSLASCAQCSGTDLLRTEMRIAEGVRSEQLGCCKRFLRAELIFRKARQDPERLIEHLHWHGHGAGHQTSHLRTAEHLIRDEYFVRPVQD